MYPWLDDEWRNLCAIEQGGRLPHGLLFAGPRDVGKHHFALRFAAYLLCANRAAAPCGECGPCALHRAGTHPDLFMLGLEDSRQLRVEQIRELIHWSSQTASQGSRKVAIIDPADAMNVQSSNALLKCLEEPTADTVIMLVSSAPLALLPTIRSRCQTLRFELPGRDAAEAWVERTSSLDLPASRLLDIAEGAPLKVLRFDDDYLALRERLATILPALGGNGESPTTVAASLAKADLLDTLDLLYHLIADTIRYSRTGGATPLRNQDLAQPLARYANETQVAERECMIDRVAQARRIAQGTSNANPNMLLEWVLSPDAGLS